MFNYSPAGFKKCRRFKAKTGRLTNYQPSACQGLDTARCISLKFKKTLTSHFLFYHFFFEKKKSVLNAVRIPKNTSDS